MRVVGDEERVPGADERSQHDLHAQSFGTREPKRSRGTNEFLPAADVVRMLQET